MKRAWLRDGKDVYITPILTHEEFKNITQTTKGYIIIDSMSRLRIDKDIEDMKNTFTKLDGYLNNV
ncbi:MAG: hypothetical protein U9P44_00435 [archaeon]|nr:hypothetical protein [archaeon]